MALLHYLEVLRLTNCLMAAIAVYIAYSISVMRFSTDANALAAMLAAFLICGAGQAINDYFDRNIDARIRPEKPLPAGKLKPANVLFYALSLFTAGILISFFINSAAFFIALSFSLLLIFYSAFLHRYKYLGNWIVASGTAFTFIFGAAAANGSYEIVKWLALSALMINVGRELTKDFEDLKADAGYKRSLPMLLPKNFVIFLIFVFYTAGIAAAFFIFLIGLVKSILFILLITLSAVVIIYSISKLLQNDYSASHKLSKFAMVAALAAFASILVW